MTREEEISRLVAEPLERDPSVKKILVSFNVHCAGDAALVLSRTKEVLLSILQQDPYDWPSIDQWRRRLPAWFVARSAVEASPRRRLHLSLAKPSRMNQSWSVEAFVFWFTPSERAWFWWNARIENPNLFQVEVVAIDLPFPWESLDWLLRAAGALRVEEV